MPGVVTGEIDGQHVSVFKNDKWSEEEKEKQPLYLAHRTVGKAEDVGDDQTS